MQDQATDAPATSYAYKASLIGAAHQFELTVQGLSWRVAGRAGEWRYADIAAIRLSYRPASMQQHRFCADIRHQSGARLSILSTSWQTAALMAPQDQRYRAFITALHARMASAGSRAELTAGLGAKTYMAALALVAMVAVMMLALFIGALAADQWAGALFFAGFAVLFGWQVGGFVLRNRPLSYRFNQIPEALLP